MRGARRWSSISRRIASSLSEDSLARLERNPLRILDTKDPKERPIADAAPSIDDYLTNEASDFFAQVTAGLDAAGVQWTRNSRLVRGLDYYRHTAFEFVTDRLGAQGTVIAGGRYDGLIELLRRPAHARGRLGGRDRATRHDDRACPEPETHRCRDHPAWAIRLRSRGARPSSPDFAPRGRCRGHGLIAAT